MQLHFSEIWGIGQKNKDNGVLILAAMEDRRMTIITGYGVEGLHCLMPFKKLLS